jgi:hypothetical protein
LPRSTSRGGHGNCSLLRRVSCNSCSPDGSPRGLLWISDWDFGWQDSYFYKRTIALPRGTRVDVEIAYDNSTANIRNPSLPPKPVRWGLGSFDEMGSMSLLVAPSSPDDEEVLRRAQARHFREQIAQRFFRR